MKGNIQEVTERSWWPRLFWLWCCNVRKQEGSNYSWLNVQCIFLQIRLLVYEIHLSEDLLKIRSYKFLHMMYLVQNQFQLMCGWVLVVNGSFPHYTFGCLKSSLPSTFSTQSNTTKIPKNILITQLSMYSMLKKKLDFGDHLLC